MELLKRIFPGLALKREIARLNLQKVERAYEAGGSSQYYKPLSGYSTNPNVDMQNAGSYMRATARNLDENMDLVVGLFDTLVLRVVGNGTPIRPLVRRPDGSLHTEFNTRLTKLWIDWGRTPTICGQYTINQALKLIARAWLRDGEFLTKFVRGTRIKHPGNFPFSLELIDSDYLPYDLSTTAKDPKNIVQGVELNRYAAPIAYHLYEEHPGTNFRYIPANLKTRRYSAKDIIHLKFVRRPSQVRGVTILHSVIHRIEDLKDYEESERIAARVAAAMTGYIEKNGESLTTPGADGERAFEMAPGMIFDNLLPGEKVGTISSNRPNPELINFRSSMLKAIAAGTSSNYSTISRNYDGTYSSQRQELLETTPAYESLRQEFVDGELYPIWKEFVHMMQLSGNIKPDDIDPDTLTNIEARAIDVGWIDPKKQAEATDIAINLGLTTRGQVIRDQGGDPQAVFSEIDEEKEIFGELNPIEENQNATENEPEEDQE